MTQAATYQLFASRGRASMAPEALLEQMGVPYKLVELDPDPSRRPAAYRRVNPLGQLPTLVDGDATLYESAAICIHLCDRHPEAGMAPRIGTPERGRFYQWLFLLSNTLQPTYMLGFYPERFLEDPLGRTQLRQNAEGRLPALWRQIDAGLAASPFLSGRGPGAADVYLYMLSTWHREAILPLASLAAVSRVLDATAALPGVQKMMDRNRGF